MVLPPAVFALRHGGRGLRAVHQHLSHRLRPAAIREIGLIDFLLGKTWAPTTTVEPSFGILPFILTSVYGTAGAVLLGVPVGLMTAIFLAKVAPPKAAKVIHTAVELLAGIPSVVYGLVGMIVLVPAIRELFGLSSGACLLAAIIVLAIMILPSIINVSETALRAVPQEYEEASLALGATEMETYFRVSLPAAGSGVATAVVLGVGRAIGEAMAIIMVAGNVANMPGLFTSVRFLTNAIAYNKPGGSVHVALSDTPEGQRLTVSDTGIGIPRDLQERVFERFFRVDKSHSGCGTGLGLSIVKHGAAYLGVRVALASELGKGSTFTLTFPPA